MISKWLFIALLAQTGKHPWPHDPAARTLADDIPPPAGYSRTTEPDGSMGAWLRRLPLKTDGSPVRLFDGRLKGNQSAQVRIVDMDVGKKDHQQCADATMRLRAEYLFSQGRHGSICFRATNGAPLPWSTWKEGQRPRVAGRTVAWRKTAAPDAAWPTFRQYLDFVFVYAGTYSLAKELQPVDAAQPIQPGDVFIQGGFPGHAVIVVDVAENGKGQRVFLLAQSYMPAQDIHILRGEKGAKDPWYRFPVGEALETPEWTFAPARRMRFAETGCAPPGKR